MSGQLIAIAILLPAIAGVLVYLIQSPVFRRGVVIANGAMLAVTAVALARPETLEANLPDVAGLDWPQALGVADLLLGIVLVYVAVRARHSLATALAVAQLALIGYVEFGLGHLPAVHPTFALDRLSTTLGLIVSIVGSLICIYALRYMDEHEEHSHVAPSRQPRFFLFMLLFLGAMNGLVFANDLRWLFLFWEITTLCSFMLIGHDGTPVATANAVRALWMNLLGGLAFAGSLWLLAVRGHEATLKTLVDGSGGPPVLFALSLLAFAGLTKAAQMPFQSWLLGAMVAPTPVSALLHSSAMVKAGVYLVVRLAPGFRDTPLSDAVALAGAFTFLAAAILAFMQSDSKSVLAYSTVSNLGLIIACAGINTSLALAAALLLILFHAVSKALLFLTVGSIEHAIGSRDIEAMEGLARRHTKLAVIAAIGIVSMALPPGGMLLAKWIAIESAARVPLLTVLFAVGSAATLGFWTRWMGRLFTTLPGTTGSPSRLETIYALTLGPLVAAIGVLSLLAGVIVEQFLEPGMRLYFAAGVVRPAGVGVASGTSWFPIGWLFATVVVALGVPAVAVAIRPTQIRSTYLCGENVRGASGEEFYTAGEQPWRLDVASSYLKAFFREDLMVRWGNVAAVLLIVTLFWMGYR